MRVHSPATSTVRPPPSRRHTVAIVLLALLTASVSFPSPPEPPAAAGGESAPASTLRQLDAAHTGGAPRADRGVQRRLGAAPPTEFAPVTVQSPRVRVDGVGPGALDAALDAEGVSFATMVAVADVAIAEPGGSRTPARVAMVDAAGFRVLTPQMTADALELWQRLTEGDAVFTHEHAQRLDLQLGTEVPMGESGVPVRVGAFATTGIPPLADAIVNAVAGERLGLGQAPRSLLVALYPDAQPEAVARQLERQLQAPARVIADPRTPRSVDLTGDITPDNVWDWLAQCESSGDWHINTGNGYYGGLQFLPESWLLVGGTGMPHEASREEQIARAKRLHAIQGWKAWPVCSILLGLRPGPLPERYRDAGTADAGGSQAPGDPQEPPEQPRAQDPPQEQESDSQPPPSSEAPEDSDSDSDSDTHVPPLP